MALTPPKKTVVPEIKTSEYLKKEQEQQEQTEQKKRGRKPKGLVTK